MDREKPATNQIDQQNGPSNPKRKNDTVNGGQREGGDDALSSSSTSDPRSDEKIIVNEQRGNKTVNIPSQTGVNTSEGSGLDDEIIDQIQDSDE